MLIVVDVHSTRSPAIQEGGGRHTVLDRIQYLARKVLQCVATASRKNSSSAGNKLGVKYDNPQHTLDPRRHNSRGFGGVDDIFEHVRRLVRILAPSATHSGRPCRCAAPPRVNKAEAILKIKFSQRDDSKVGWCILKFTSSFTFNKTMRSLLLVATLVAAVSAAPFREVCHPMSEPLAVFFL